MIVVLETGSERFQRRQDQERQSSAERSEDETLADGTDECAEEEALEEAPQAQGPRCGRPVGAAQSGHSEPRAECDEEMTRNQGKQLTYIFLFRFLQGEKDEHTFDRLDSKYTFREAFRVPSVYF